MVKIANTQKPGYNPVLALHRMYIPARNSSLSARGGFQRISLNSS